MLRTLLTVLTILAVWAPPASASELYEIRNSPSYAGSAPAVASAFLEDRATQYRLVDVTLRVRQTLAFGDCRTVRLEQVHGGLPVLGTAAAVRVSPMGRVTTVALRLARALTVSTTPRVTPGEVRTLLYSFVGPWAATGRLNMLLAVVPEADGPGLLVWQVDVPNGRGGLRYLVDAQRGVVLYARPLAVETLGRVYPISSVVTPNPQDLELPDLDDATPLRLNGYAGSIIVTNYVSGDPNQGDIVAEQTVGTSDGTDFLYDPPTDPTDPTDAFAQVGLYYHLARMRNFFTDTLGVDFTPAGWQLGAVANVMEGSQPMDNAYFSEQGLGAPFNTPNVIAVGQGSQLDFADDSDVFLHEFTHYVTHNAIGYNMSQMGTNSYGMSPFSGAIDEGMADYFACTENGDPVLGEASLQPYGSERDLTDTSKVCPDDVFGEVHMDGEIMGSLAWTMQVLVGKTVGDQLIWGAMTLLLPYATFGDFSAALLDTANTMVTQGQLTSGDVQSIQDELDARGLSDCYQELPIAEGSPRIVNMFGLDLIAMMGMGNCQSLRQNGVQLHSMFHFRATPAADDEGLRIAVALTPEGGTDLHWSIYARVGEHVGFYTSGFMPNPVSFDYTSDWFDSFTGELVIDADSDPPFDPTQTYHFVIVQQNCPSSMAEITVEAAEPVVEPDAGVDAGPADAAVTPDASDGEPDNPDKGCSCNTTDPGTPWILLAFGLFLFWRRRRAGHAPRV